MTQFIEHSLFKNFYHKQHTNKPNSNFLYNYPLKSLKTRYTQTPSFCFISNKQTKQKPLFFICKNKAFVCCKNNERNKQRSIQRAVNKRETKPMFCIQINPY